MAADCSLGGTCENGACKCWPTWTGPNCSVLNLQPTEHIGAWERKGNQSSWGGSIVQDPKTGIYHMYSADMTQHCGLNSWQHNSAIVHLTATDPSGPCEWLPRLGPETFCDLRPSDCDDTHHQTFNTARLWLPSRTTRRLISPQMETF